MMSALEQRQIIEAAFLPLECRCSVDPDDTLTVQILDPDSGDQLLKLPGVSRASLATSRDISRFVLHLRQELQDQQAARQGRSHLG